MLLSARHHISPKIVKSTCEKGEDLSTPASLLDGE